MNSKSKHKTITSQQKPLHKKLCVSGTLLEYREGRELPNANWQRVYQNIAEGPVLFGPATDFTTANVQTPRNQQHTGTEVPNCKECPHKYLHILPLIILLNRCTTDTQAGWKHRASVWFFSSSIPYLYLQRLFFPKSQT